MSKTNKSVTIETAKNGFLVSSYNDKTGNRDMTVHKDINDAMGMMKKMIGGDMGHGMTVTADQKKAIKKIIKKK